jgi:hypothetical protein
MEKLSDSSINKLAEVLFNSDCPLSLLCDAVAYHSLILPGYWVLTPKLCQEVLRETAPYLKHSVKGRQQKGLGLNLAILCELVCLPENSSLPPQTVANSTHPCQIIIKITEL